MIYKNREVIKTALSLPPVERAALIEKLFKSFDFSDSKHIDFLWAKEAEDRIDAFENGKMKSIPAAKVFNKLNRKK